MENSVLERINKVIDNNVCYLHQERNANKARTGCIILKHLIQV